MPKNKKPLWRLLAAKGLSKRQKARLVAAALRKALT